MTKQGLIEFIQSAYEDDEELCWQIVCRENIEAYSEAPISIEKWDDFVDYTERYSTLADPYTENAVEQFQQFQEGN